MSMFSSIQSAARSSFRFGTAFICPESIQSVKYIRYKPSNLIKESDREFYDIRSIVVVYKTGEVNKCGFERVLSETVDYHCPNSANDTFAEILKESKKFKSLESIKLYF